MIIIADGQRDLLLEAELNHLSEGQEFPGAIRN
jgi:hypothetical protein